VNCCEPYKSLCICLPIQFFKHSAQSRFRSADTYGPEEDLEMKVEIITDSDICALCGGKLREGLTELVLKAGEDLAVIKRVSALVCSCCGEAYLTPEVSEKVDRAMKKYRAGRLLARPIAAGESLW